MTLKAYPWDDTVVTESDYSRLFGEIAPDGVGDFPGGAGFRVLDDGTGLQVSIHSGFAVVHGLGVHNTTTEYRALDPAISGDRIDRLTIRLDPANNAVTLRVKKGAEGTGVPPSVTQTESGEYEMSLAQLRVNVGSTVVQVTDERKYILQPAVAWNGTAGRPDSPRVGTIGYDGQSRLFFFWDGDEWKPFGYTPPSDEITDFAVLMMMGCL